jgi:hypothetical protein
MVVAAFVENEKPLEFAVEDRPLLPQGIRLANLVHGV